MLYRFKFEKNIPAEAIEENLFWAVFNTESLYGKPKVRLEASFLFDKDKRVCVIDKATEVGQHIAQLFTSLITRQFGEEAFVVERIEKKDKSEAEADEA